MSEFLLLNGCIIWRMDRAKQPGTPGGRSPSFCFVDHSRMKYFFLSQLSGGSGWMVGWTECRRFMLLASHGCLFLFLFFCVSQAASA